MQNKIIVKESDISFHHNEAKIFFRFKYNSKKGTCWYQVFSTDETDNKAGILALNFPEEYNEDIFSVINEWANNHIEFIPRIIYKSNKQ